MNWPDRARWLKLCNTAGATKPASDWYDRLTLAHAEPQRFYHNQIHLAECLAEFDQARTLARNPVAVELALWFHDSVYDPTAGDNEEQSADLASQCLVELGIGQDLLEEVVDLIMATKSHEVGDTPDAALMVDVDLSILGREPERFLEYEAQIRQEYHWVPLEIFSLKRAEILRRFLGRNQIYNTAWFHSKYEHQARINLQGSVGASSQER